MKEPGIVWKSTKRLKSMCVCVQLLQPWPLISVYQQLTPPDGDDDKSLL